MLLPFYFMPLAGLLVCVFLGLTGCAKSEQDTMQRKLIRLPGGEKIYAEVMMRQEEMMKGMMFRPPLGDGRGMLFVHAQPGRYTYWMHNVKVPLDIIWMDAQRRIVEISANTPPCLDANPLNCPHYGGNHEARFVLELDGGMAAKYQLAVGQVLDF